MLYDPAMHEETAYRLRIQDGLRRALEDGSFELHYQPIVSLPSGSGWLVPKRYCGGRTPLGRMFPDVFIPIAEVPVSQPRLDEWVVREACSSQLHMVGCRCLYRSGERECLTAPADRRSGRRRTARRAITGCRQGAVRRSDGKCRRCRRCRTGA